MQVKMDILMPKVAIGLKLPYEGLTGELLKQELLLKILMEETFSSTSDNYRNVRLRKSIIPSIQISCSQQQDLLCYQLIR